MGVLDDLRRSHYAEGEKLLANCEDRVPVLATMPGRDRARGLDSIVFGLHEVLHGTRSGTPARSDVEFWSEYFGDSAQRGVPLSIQQQVVRCCMAGVLRSAWANAAEDDVTDLIALTSIAGLHQSSVLRHAAEAYHQLYAELGDHARARRLLAEDLLAGTSPDQRAWLVVVVPRNAGPVPDLPSTHRPSGTVVLAPADPSRESAEEKVRSYLGMATAGGCWASTAADVPRAYGEAVHTARAATAALAARSLLFPADLALERHLLNDAALGAELSSPVIAIGDNPNLIATLHALIDHDFDRTATAAHLHINRRTLTHRLNRIATLTGYDPRTARGFQVLANALTARGVVRLDPPATKN